MRVLLGRVTMKITVSFMMLCGYFVNTFFAYFYIIYHMQTLELFLASRLANLVAVNARSELLLAQ